MIISGKSTIKLLLIGSSLFAIQTGSLYAQGQNTGDEGLLGAISNGKTYVDLRLRHELVDQTGFASNANATTLRTKLGYETAKFNDFSAAIEFEHSAELLGGDYNNGINGRTNYPAIIDANHTEVNQAKLTYTGIKDTTVVGGRQAINISTQRFVGTVGWRQNDQTYDSVAVINKSIKGLTATYGYVWNVNRIFGNDHPLGDLKTNTHVFNANYKAHSALNIEAYGYLIELKNVAVRGLSSKTFGIRASGGQNASDDVKIIYAAEYANQTDYRNNPMSFSVDYYMAEAGVVFNGLTLKGGMENLGSENGIASFKTPLATLHKFNGWADKFLNTPNAGLRDYYGQASYAISNTNTELDGTSLTVVYHKFKSDFGGISYGSEVDASVSKKILDQFTVLLKYAHYNADTFATDTSKFWFQVATRF